MLNALYRAIAVPFAPPVRRIVGVSLLLAAASFSIVAAATVFVLHRAAPFAWHPLNWLLDLTGGIAVAVLSWLLFPAVVTIVISFFLDRIAAAVEARDYPDNGPPRPAAIGEAAAATLRLMALTIFLNVLALPVYVLAPGLNFFVFLGLNGYLLGRTYFEVVALRRLDPMAARAVRRRFAGRVFLGGLAIAGLFAVPLVNLVAPVIATVLMVHLFEGLRPAPAPAPASGPQLVTARSVRGDAARSL
jgi:CysZ protein